MAELIGSVQANAEDADDARVQMSSLGKLVLRMRFTGFKTKAFFTLGIYTWVWHARVVTWLKEEFGAPITGQETWRLFIPFYGLVVWWRYLAAIREVEVKSFAAADFSRGGKPLSVGRAFFWSSMWFSGGPYVNRHLNALDAFKRGQVSQAVQIGQIVSIEARATA